MRSVLATFCLALALAGCRGTGGGLFGQMTIPPPGTQPPGALLADNSYYPGTSPAIGNSPSTSIPAASAAPAFTSTFNPPAGASPSILVPPGSSAASDSPLTERRSATLSRANLAGSSRTPASGGREEPILIPSDSATAGKLAAVIPIRGIPTTDATGLFEQIRSQLTPPASLAAQPRAPSGFVEISQLPNPTEDLRRAALSRQQLR